MSQKGFASKGRGSKKAVLVAQWLRKASHVYRAFERPEGPLTGYFSESHDGGRLFGVPVPVSQASLRGDFVMMPRLRVLPW